MESSIKVNAQWQWAEHYGSSYFPYNESADVFSDGVNNYLIGSFGGTFYMPFDTLFSSGSNDLFITKFDPSGQKIWSKQFGGFNSSLMNWERVSGVFDPINNCIYLTGEFYGMANFDIAGTLISTGVNTDLFLAKMDLNGNFIWVKGASGMAQENAKLAVNSAGNIYLIVQSNDSIQFDSHKLGPGGSLVEYDAFGNCTFARSMFSSLIGANSNYVSVSFLGSDLIFFGAFRSVPFLIDTAVLTPFGNLDAFIARADSVGNLKWIKQFGGLGIDVFQGLAVDDSSNIYVIGGFQDSINLDGNILQNSGSDILFSKFDSNGSTLWVKQAFVTGNVAGASNIIPDRNGNCYFVGSFSGTVTLGNFSISTVNSNDMFLTRYDNMGDCWGVSHFGNAHGVGLTIDQNGSVYCAGIFQNNVTIGNTTFTCLGGMDIYLAKHDAITGFTGFEKSTSTNQLLIQANPNSGKCTINLPEELVNEKNLSLSIYNNKGQLIQRLPLQFNESKIKLNLEAEAKGMYNAVLSNGTKNYSGKIIFE